MDHILITRPFTEKKYKKLFLIPFVKQKLIVPIVKWKKQKKSFNIVKRSEYIIKTGFA